MSTRITAQSRSEPARTRRGPHMSRKTKLSKKVTVKKLASKVSKLSKAVEVKRLDQLSAANSISNTSTFFLLNGTAQGDDSQNREGNTAYFSSVYIKGEITVSDASNTVRIMLIWDNQTNQGAPTEAALFAYTAYPHISTINYDQRERFRVLADDVYVVDSDDPVVYFKRFVKIGRKTYYSASTNVVGSINRGSLYLVAVSDSAATSHPALTFQSRCHFTG